MKEHGSQNPIEIGSRRSDHVQYMVEALATQSRRGAPVVPHHPVGGLCSGEGRTCAVRPEEHIGIGADCRVHRRRGRRVSVDQLELDACPGRSEPRRARRPNAQCVRALDSKRRQRSRQRRQQRRPERCQRPASSMTVIFDLQASWRALGISAVSSWNMPEVAATFPEWMEPMAATLTQERFDGPEWSFERKLDGIRLLAFKDGQQVRLLSRNKLAQNDAYPSIVEAVAHLPVHNVILDGEATGAWGVHGAVAYHVFDVLWLDGRDVTSQQLEIRRALLSRLPLPPPLARVPVVHDDKPWEGACREGWEGVIAKRRGSPYEHRRSPHWLKMKCEATQELVVGGLPIHRAAGLVLGRCSSATSNATISCSPARSARASTHACCSSYGDGSM